MAGDSVPGDEPLTAIDGDKITGFVIRLSRVDCPKHGPTENIITSTVKDHEGHWCQLCWLDMLGPSLPLMD